MPITYECDHQRRLITVTVTEPYSIDGILGGIVRQAVENTWAYAMLYDLRSVTHVSTGAELKEIANRVKVVGSGRQRGAVGMAIGGQPALFRAGLMFSKLTRTLMTVEILLTGPQLEAWLDRNARGVRGDW
jgi:hypothetical protein